MGKLEEAKGILSVLGMPDAQTNDRSAYVLLSLANLCEKDDWSASSKPTLRIIDIMNFMAMNYNKRYKPNTRETIRKNTIHQFVEGAIADRNTDSSSRAINSPKYCYCLTDEMLGLIKTYGTNKWQEALKAFIEQKGTLTEKYSQHREIVRIPVNINGQTLSFSPGEHNQLQKEVIEQFASRFAKGAEILYIGDSDNKDLIKNQEKLSSLGVTITEHDKLPDIVLYIKDKNRLLFIETVTSGGPMSMKRVAEIDGILHDCNCWVIYITAFPNTSLYKKFIDQLAWETEVWIAGSPDHMIHLNGDKFMDS